MEEKSKKKRPLRWLALLLVLVLAVGIVLGVRWLGERPTGQHHYLLVGMDGWGKLENHGRSDVVMLVTLDFDRSKLLLTSFLRDTEVILETGRNAKLNTLVQKESGTALQDYLELNFDIEIRGTLTTNFTGMVALIDAIGGVTVPLTKGELREVRGNAGEYDGFPLHEGECRLNGAQALAFMRIRKLDNDMGRANRQAITMNAVVQQAKNIGINEALALLSQVQNLYLTDLDMGQQAQLVRDAYRLRNAPMERQQIPADGTYRYGTLRSSGSVLKMNLEKNQEAFRVFLGKAPQAEATGE